jgi:4-hydroxy-tetrahydrodipicolinate synthase
VAAIKIPGTPFADETGEKRLSQLRGVLPESIAIGVSGDKFGTAGMVAGCDLWLSVLGGLFPKTVKRLIELSKLPNTDNALNASSELDALWQLFAQYKGGLRVMATAAEILGFSECNCLPAPLQTLTQGDRLQLENVLSGLALE